MDKACWQNVLDSLSIYAKHTGELHKYRDVKTNSERVKLCSQNPLVVTKLKEWYSHLRLKQTYQKDVKLSLQHKMNGNKAYGRKNIAEALKLYTKALIVSPENEIALLYGNRSAVLFEQCLWQKCIIDVDVAILKGFPVDKLWKLYKRKGEALFKLKRIDESIICFDKSVELLMANTNLKKELDQVKKLLDDATNSDYVEVLTKNTNEMNIQESVDVPFHGFSQTVTSISKCLSICENETEGRHFIANEKIDAGKSIIVERPYAYVLLPDWYQSHCQHCLVKVDLLYPCKMCTEVCYCSIECQEESWKSYHYFECGKLILMAEIGVAHLALRIILISEMKTLSKFFGDAPIVSHGIKGFNSDGIYESNYESLYHLTSHVEKLQPEDMYQYTAASVFLLNLLSESDYFPSDTTDDTKFQVGGLILLHILQIICNAHAIGSIESTSNISENVVEQEQVRIATALYPTASICNHSCVPNILNVFEKDKLVVQVTEDIAKGEQIYTCYGPHYRKMELSERQTVLKKQYFFHCTCEACSKGLKSMEEFDCFRCPNCDMNICTKSVSCTHCSSSIDSSLIQDYEQKEAKASKMFRLGLDKVNEISAEEQLNYDAYRDALSMLLNCMLIQSTIYYKFHSSLGKTYDLVAKCYAVLYDYPNSILHIKKSIEVVVTHYGDNSIEVMNEYMKLSDCYMALMQLFIDEGEIAGIDKFYSDAVSTLEHCMALQFRNNAINSSDVVDLRRKYDSLKALRYVRES